MTDSAAAFPSRPRRRHLRGLDDRDGGCRPRKTTTRGSGGRRRREQEEARAPEGGEEGPTRRERDGTSFLRDVVPDPGATVLKEERGATRARIARGHARHGGGGTEGGFAEAVPALTVVFDGATSEVCGFCFGRSTRRRRRAPLAHAPRGGGRCLSGVMIDESRCPKTSHLRAAPARVRDGGARGPRPTTRRAAAARSRSSSATASLRRPRARSVVGGRDAAAKMLQEAVRRATLRTRIRRAIFRRAIRRALWRDSPRGAHFRRHLTAPRPQVVAARGGDALGARGGRVRVVVLRADSGACSGCKKLSRAPRHGDGRRPGECSLPAASHPCLHRTPPPPPRPPHLHRHQRECIAFCKLPANAKRGADTSILRMLLRWRATKEGGEFGSPKEPVGLLRSLQQNSTPVPAEQLAALSNVTGVSADVAASIHDPRQRARCTRGKRAGCAVGADGMAQPRLQAGATAAVSATASSASRRSEIAEGEEVTISYVDTSKVLFTARAILYAILAQSAGVCGLL